jgi:DMSO/TMAO reductase YedYZ heme-binding membrane subunit
MLAQLVDGPLLWFANRGTGVVLLGLLTLSTALGVLSTARASSARWPRFATQALHRDAALLTCALLAVHVLTAVVDSYVDIRWWEAFLPRPGGYGQPWLGLGALALDLLVAIVVTSLVRQRMRHRTWRGIHLLTYLVWGLGIVHGVLIGTDSGAAWAKAVTVTSVGVVGAAAVVRLATLRHERRLAARTAQEHLAPTGSGPRAGTAGGPR